MAAEVEDVDLIVGGHSHTFLFSGEQYLNLLQNFFKFNFLIGLKGSSVERSTYFSKPSGSLQSQLSTRSFAVHILKFEMLQTT